MWSEMYFLRAKSRPFFLFDTFVWLEINFQSPNFSSQNFVSQIKAEFLNIQTERHSQLHYLITVPYRELLITRDPEPNPNQKHMPEISIFKSWSQSPFKGNRPQFSTQTVGYCIIDQFSLPISSLITSYEGQPELTVSQRDPKLNQKHSKII